MELLSDFGIRKDGEKFKIEVEAMTIRQLIASLDEKKNMLEEFLRVQERAKTIDDTAVLIDMLKEAREKFIDSESMEQQALLDDLEFSIFADAVEKLRASLRTKFKFDRQSKLLNEYMDLYEANIVKNPMANRKTLESVEEFLTDIEKKGKEARRLPKKTQRVKPDGTTAKVAKTKFKVKEK